MLVAIGTVLAAFVAIDLLREVDRVEVAGTALYLLVLAGAVVGWRAGLVAGLVATFGYAVARRGAVDLAGSDVVNRLIAARALGYVTFGAVGGWLGQRVRTVLESVPEPTGRASIGAELAREIDRARRHHRPLAVVTLDLTDAPGDVVDVVPDGMDAALRTSDLAVVVREDDAVAVTIVLPETDAAGAEVVVDRLRRSLGPLPLKVATLGSDPARVEALRDRLVLAEAAPNGAHPSRPNPPTREQE
jgi:hypothetical protein